MKILLNLLVIVLALAVLPMSYYNMYHILKAVNASDVMWVFFWISLPATIILTIIGKIAEMMKDHF